MKIEIDPLKVPAFQRKRNIRLNKARSFGMEVDPEMNTLNRLKQENLSALRNAHIIPATEMREPVSYAADKPIPEKTVNFTWRKMERIGEVEQYFAKINVIAFKLEKPLKIGERIIIESPKGLFEEELTSMQINRQDIQAAKKGDDVGIKLRFEPKVGGAVYKVVAEG